MSKLQLQQLVPSNLEGRASLAQSEVWLKSLEWEGGAHRVFVQAPSGTGKTTLLLMLYGLRPDYKGSIRWNGTEIRDMNDDLVSSWRREHWSTVFQDLRIFPELTAWENVEVKRNLVNSSTAEEAKEMFRVLGLSDKVSQAAGTLSFGEQQRLAIIRALVQPFDWLLMDEPFSHLDDANKHRAASLIESVVRSRNASLLIADLDDNSFFPYTQKLSL